MVVAFAVPRYSIRLDLVLTYQDIDLVGAHLGNSTGS